MNRNLVGSFLGRSSINFAHLVPIRLQTWPSQTIPVSDLLPTKFSFILPSGFRREDFFKSANQKQELPMVAMFVNGSEINEQNL
jgi:hypothetical protein